MVRLDEAGDEVAGILEHAVAWPVSVGDECLEPLAAFLLFIMCRLVHERRGGD